MNFISFGIGFLFGNLFAFVIGFIMFMNTSIYFINKYGTKEIISEENE